MTDPDKTLTIALEGAVPLPLFATAVRGFDELVDALTEDVANEDLPWVIYGLEFGSATMTIRAESEALEAVARVQGAFNSVGRALRMGEPIPYSPRVVAAARRITGIIDGRVTAVRFEAGDEVTTVTTSGETARKLTVGAYGSVEGTVESATMRKGVQFTIYDALGDHAVTCRLRSDQADLVRLAWGRRALVRGWVIRDADTGRSLAVSPVDDVEVLPEVIPGAFRRARGVLAGLFEDEAPAAAVRRLRDS